MTPQSLIPLAEPVPVPWVWFDILLIVTFTAHILFMNSLLGSATIGLVRAFKGEEGLARAVGMKLPPLLALTINMGVAPLLFLQVNYGHFDYVSSVLMGGWWLMVVAVLLFSYYGFYIYKFKYEAMSSTLRTVLYCSSLVGLLYVGFMLSNNTTLMLRPEAWGAYFDKGTFLNLDDPTIYPRFLHFMVSALAIGGLFIALLGKFRKNDEYIEVGMKWFTHSTLVNIAVGMWFLMSLPRDIMLGFMGGSIPATLTLMASIVAGAISLAVGFQKKPVNASIWAATTVFFMACTRHWLRTFYLEPYFTMESTPVTHEYGSLYLFLGFLVVGLALLGYMLKLYFKAREGRS